LYNNKVDNNFDKVISVELNWMNPKQAAESWGISDRRVQALCAAGKVQNATRLERGWLIPKDAPKPLDGRRNNGRKSVKNN
jgi:hypothetical protein